MDKLLDEDGDVNGLNMFGSAADVREALERNEMLAKELEEKGFNLTGPEEDFKIPEPTDLKSFKQVQEIAQDGEAFWRDLYYQNSVIIKQLEQKIKEFHG